MANAPDRPWSQLSVDERLAAMADTPFAKAIEVSGNQVSLRFDLDLNRWPWLCLPAHDPILINNYQYFASTTACWATGLMAPGSPSALTYFTWQLEAAALNAGRPAQGQVTLQQDERRTHMVIEVFGRDGRRHYRGECDGADLGDRDFAQWRARGKAEVRQRCPRIVVARADATAVGLSPEGICWVSPPREDGAQTCFDVQIDRTEGFYPAHPFHGGSGDHVNASQLADCAMQAAHLLLPDLGPLICWRGEQRFQRFVELDAPFQLRVRSLQRDSGRAHLALGFDQAERHNADFKLTLGAAR